MSDYIKRKEYKLPNGRTVTADFNELGIAQITIQAMDALFDILNSSAQPEQRWIPCSERLPEESGDYLVTVERYSGEWWVEVDQFDNANGSWWLYMDEVTAWMSLPKPYKGEES